MSTPRSKRARASLLRPRRLPVAEIASGLKLAASSSTVVVAGRYLRRRAAHYPAHADAGAGGVRDHAVLR